MVEILIVRRMDDEQCLESGPMLRLRIYFSYILETIILKWHCVYALVLYCKNKIIDTHVIVHNHANRDCANSRAKQVLNIVYWNIAT